MVLTYIQELFVSIYYSYFEEFVFAHRISNVFYNFFLFTVVFFSAFFYFLLILRIFLRDKKNNYKSKNIKWPSVTIQIPTFNEPVALRCAEYCLRFDYPKNKFNIIIGDDSNKPEVSRVIKDFVKKHKGKIKITNRGSNVGFKAGNLNHMLKFSKGEIIVIFDSDFTPPKKFLKRIVRPFIEDKKVACVQAKWGYLNQNQNIISKFASSILMVYHNIIAPINDRLGVSLLFGSGQAVRRDLILKLGGWQEGSLTEDVEFSVRLLNSGYKIIYLDDVKVSGELPFTFKGLKTQQRKWAYGNLRAFKDHAKSILFGHFSFLQKLMLIFTMVGYVSSFFLVSFTISGFLFFATEIPKSPDFIKILFQTSRLILITSGFLVAGLAVLWKERKLNTSPFVILSALTIGIPLSLSVSIGFFKGLLGKKMNWEIIKKKGNSSFNLSKNIKIDS